MNYITKLLQITRKTLELSFPVSYIQETLQEHMKVDTLIRFVRSQELKLKEAEKELRAYYEWRKSFKVDEKVAAFEKSEAKKIFEKYTCLGTRTTICLSF